MAAQAHGVDAQALLAELNAALGSDAPGWALGACREVDVRDELKRGLEPFPKIMAAVARLEPGEVLKLRAIFEPQPLYKVLGSQGFEHWTRRDAADDWAVFFRKRG
ncbi:MAG: DUF2249 domain-containing protein [Elusimicrobia bacterium]|nr:DUF2249 domain-containing protein [Elusimicrobiota bacterium]